MTHIFTNLNKERDATVVASHNKETCSLAIELIEELDLKEANIIFG